MKTTVALDRVSKTIRKQRVVKEVSMTLASGKVTGLKGPNGGGKTMLMRLISGLILPTSGTVTINGERLGRDITFPKSIGILIENPAFLDAYSGFENLKMLTRIQKKIGTDQIRSCLAQVGLDPTEKKKYKKYSLGMKQRLGIAAAIMEQPDIVILDEPTNALDASGVELVKGLVAAEKRRGALIVLACHELHTLLGMADEIYEMDEGRVCNTMNVEME